MGKEKTFSRVRNKESVSATCFEVCAATSYTENTQLLPRSYIKPKKQQANDLTSLSHRNSSSSEAWPGWILRIQAEYMAKLGRRSNAHNKKLSRDDISLPGTL